MVGGRRCQRAGLQAHVQRGVADRPPALQNMDGQAARGGRKRQPQGGGSGVLRGAGRADGDKEQVAGLGCQMQAAQGFRAHMRQPADQGAATAVFQDLFRGPEGIDGFLRGYPQQLPGIQPPAHPTGDVGHVRRLHQRNGAARFQLGQRWAQQADFAHAGVRGQQFDQGSQRPAAVRQLGGKRSVPGGQGARGAFGQLGGAPQRGMDAFRGHHYCMNIQYCSPVLWAAFERLWAGYDPTMTRPWANHGPPGALFCDLIRRTRA
ncbi:hypothetical protein D3C71_1515210 [compost metagenome]